MCFGALDLESDCACATFTAYSVRLSSTLQAESGFNCYARAASVVGPPPRDSLGRRPLLGADHTAHSVRARADDDGQQCGR